MNKRRAIEKVVEGLRDGGLHRRDFVLRAAALGLSYGTIGTLLQACSGGDKGDAGSSTPSATPPAGTPAADAAAAATPAPRDLGPLGKDLAIYNWSDYIAEDTVSNFEKEFGVKVTYDTYESNEEMVAKLQAGAAGYDLVVPSGYIVPVLQALGLIDPLEKSLLTNWGNLAPMFADTAVDPGGKFTCPWQWGTSGIAYRKDKLAAPPDSWAVFLDTKLKGKMTQMDDVREVIGSWLRYRGHSLNSVDPAELAAAKADAIASKKNLKSYVSAPVKAQLISGDVWLAQLWNGDTAQATAEQAQVGYAVPKEGCTIWLDSLVIPKSAPHKRAAHEFMNYILRPEVGANVSNATGYGSPNQAALAKMKSPIPFPTDDEMKRLEYPKDLGKDTALWDQIWTEIKSA